MHYLMLSTVMFDATFLNPQKL